jgi:hypothetical protein
VIYEDIPDDKSMIAIWLFYYLLISSTLIAIVAMVRSIYEMIKKMLKIDKTAEPITMNQNMWRGLVETCKNDTSLFDESPPNCFINIVN